jgi:hypothetical protein
MILRTVLAVALLVLVACGGWMSAVAPPAATIEVSGGQPELPTIGKPALAYGDVAKLFRDLLQIANRVEASPAAVAQAPELDIVLLFRAEWTATTGRGRRALVWVVDPQADGGRRSIPVGAEYKDGWVLVEARGGTVVLRKGGESKTIAMFESGAETP